MTLNQFINHVNDLNSISCIKNSYDYFIDSADEDRIVFHYENVPQKSVKTKDVYRFFTKAYSYDDAYIGDYGLSTASIFARSLVLALISSNSIPNEELEIFNPTVYKYIKSVRYMLSKGIVFWQWQMNHLDEHYRIMNSGSSIFVYEDKYRINACETDKNNLVKELGLKYTDNVSDRTTGIDNVRPYTFLIKDVMFEKAVNVLVLNSENVSATNPKSISEVVGIVNTNNHRVYYQSIIDKFIAYILVNDSEAIEGLSFSKVGGYLQRNEGYKYSTYHVAHGMIYSFGWSKSYIGTGKIANDFSGVLSKCKNLVSYYQITDAIDILKETKEVSGIEDFLYCLYYENEDELSFERACDIFGRKYDLIGFLFFIKDKSKYLPIRPSFFEKGFKKLGIEYVLCGMCSWENYNGFIEQIRLIQENLQKTLPMKDDEQVTLLDAHSFVWVIQQDGFLGWNPTQKEIISTDVVKRNYKEIARTNRTQRAVEICNEIEKTGLLGKEREVIIKQRVNQDAFRRSLLARYDRTCCMCGVDDEKLLVASHIKPWAVSESDEKLDPDNGLLLCPNHDKLFDKGYISVDDDGHIIVSDQISDMSRLIMLELVNNENPIQLTDGNRRYLKYHRKDVFENSK